MPFSETLADRVREFLYDHDPDAAMEELRMMGGCCFMYNGKMLVGVLENALMCRVDPAAIGDLLEEPGCREMSIGGRPRKGYVLVDEPCLRTLAGLRRYMQLALEYNPLAKASRRRK